MSDIKNQLIKDSYNYVLQSDLSTGIVYRIGGDIPVNPTFLSGLTINSGFTFQNGTEFDGYVLTCDSNGYASWKPVSSATGNYLSISGGTLSGDLTVPNILVTGITATTISGNGITGNTLNANQTINFPTTTGSTYGVINQDGRRLLHTYGTRNIFLGSTSGNFTASTGVTGITDNIGIGVNTLNGLTTGKRNIGIGLSSLISTTTGTDNIGIGNAVLQNNITSSFNTGVGQYSLQATTSSRNTSIGYQSLFSNVTGASNVAIGHNAGYNETGSNKLHIANTDTKTLIYGEFDNNRVGINTSSLSNAFTVSGSTDPIKLIGLQPANDNNLLTVDGSGVVHTYSLTALTASTSNLYLSLSGGTVSGRTTFQSGLTANAITATTISASTITTNAITATTISASTITANAITATTISAATYQNLPNTLYTGNGTLSSNRTVNQNELSLTFTGTTASTLSILEKFKQGASSNNPSGIFSHAQGIGTTANGDYSHSEGVSSGAFGTYSHAEGSSTATGTGSHSEGETTIASGNYSHAEGLGTTANGDYSHSEGNDTQSNGHYSHSEGYHTNSVGLYSHSEGAGYIIDGSNTFEPLSNNPLTYLRIDVSGVTYEVFDGTWVSETEIVIIGNWSTIPDDSIVSRLIFNSFDVNLCYYGPYYINKVIFDSGSGQSVVTFDSGWSSIILNAITGCTNISNGIGSHSEGLSTRANGNYSHSEGIGTYADGEGQHVSGKYNITGNTTSLFVIGNGTDDDNRSDILNVNQNEVNVFGNLNAPYISGGTFFGNGSGLTNVVNSITTSTGLSGSSTSGNITLINTLPDQTVTITGGTNIQVTGTYPNFGIAVTGATSGSGAYLPLSGGTLTGDLIAPNITATTISATTYYGVNAVTGGTYSNGTITLGGSGSINTTISGLPQGTITAVTESNNVVTISSNSSPTTFTIDAATGGTYSNGVITLQGSGSLSTITGLGGSGGGGTIYYLNLSNTQTPYREFSPIPTNAAQQTTGVTINNGVTATIAQFLTPTSYPNTILIPAGIWSFYLHSYKQNNNAAFNIFCEVYIRTTGGTETLILTTDPVSVTTNSPNAAMYVTDGFYSGSSINFNDRILVKVRATNTGNQSHIITLLTEGSQHYSYATTTFGSGTPNYTTGGTYNQSTGILSFTRTDGNTYTAGTITSLYNSDDTITSNRTVNLSAYTLSFSGSSSPNNLMLSGGSVSIGSSSPNSTSILELSSTTKGFLPPRMTESQRTSISSPATGLMVYQTDGDEGLYINKSFGWVQII
jgi:hypothetical protein